MEIKTIIRQNLDENQFTQLAYNKKGKYVVSIYFRYTNVFMTRKYKDANKAYEIYNMLL